MPVAKSVTGTRERLRRASQPTAKIGIHVLSRVNASRPIAPIQSGSHASPRSRARIAAPSAMISSARPQLSVSGNEE